MYAFANALLLTDQDESSDGDDTDCEQEDTHEDDIPESKLLNSCIANFS